MENLDQGFDDTRFVDVVDEDLHCAICLNVLKEPVQCQNNEHHFCRPCIERHLDNFQTCPSCMEELTLETVRKPVRYLTKQLLKLLINCEYVDRGCAEVVQLEHLQIHIDSCGFAPVVCSNDGCGFLMNKHERIHHESEDCSYRKVNWVDHDDVRKERDEMKKQRNEMKKERDKMKTQKNETKKQRDEMKTQKDETKKQRDEMKKQRDEMKTQKDEMKTQRDKMKTQRDETKKQRDKISKQRDEMKTRLDELNDQMRHMMSEMKHPRSSTRDQLAHSDACNVKEDIFIAGGKASDSVRLNSVEMFRWSTRTWERLQPMKELRSGASSVFYENQMIIVGGRNGMVYLNNIETLNVEQQSAQWRDFPAVLTEACGAHQSVVYKDRLFILGGNDKKNIWDSIYQLLLVPPYSCELKSQMIQQRSFHGAAGVDDKIVILGGSTTGSAKGRIAGVEMYDICRNESQQMPPLPFASYGMATVSWGDSVVSIGGALQTGENINTVFMYNVHGEITMLPPMKHKRVGCSAIITGNNIVVMGGWNKEQGFLNSVECFSFDTYSWEELPPLTEARSFATAVVKPAV